MKQAEKAWKALLLSEAPKRSTRQKENGRPSLRDSRVQEIY